MQQPPVAPEGLSIPEAVLAALESSSLERVRNQGVDVDPSWWEQHIKATDLPGAVLSTVPGRRGRAITRAQVFQVAARITEGDDSDEAVLSLLWHALAWGSGRRYRQNDRRINALRSNDAVKLLRRAAEVSTVEPRAAYSILIRRGGGVIEGMGPSFFTKFLYFAGAGQPQHPCLILDANVAKALHHQGWTSLRPGWLNWYTDTYVSYCELLARWAGSAGKRLDRAVALDEIDYALFKLGKAGPAGTVGPLIGSEGEQP
jgi:hypothetical protein